MNLLLLFPEEVDEDGDALVTGPRALQLAQGVGARPGDRIHVGLLNGPMGQATVQSVDHTDVRLSVRLESTAPPPPQTRVVLAIPRPKMLRRLIPQLVSFGLSELILLRTWRVQRSYLQADVLQPENYRPLVLDGMMQACITHEPKVRVERRFLEFVEQLELLPGLHIVFDPRADATLADIKAKGPARSLAFGPEGGFVDAEVDSLNRAGFRSARLCGPILKVETACIAGLAQLELHSAWLDES